jgi:hypothetical protein
MKKPRIKKCGCLWIVLRHGHPVYEWSYDRCHERWEDALEDALTGDREWKQ